LPTPSIAPRRDVPALPIIAVTLAGLVLRLFAARGDLWLDEIWSLQNLEKIHSVGEIFWGMSQDNNHFLNSLWLWFTGPRAPALIIRLEAVVCGTLTIPIAAWLCRRAGATAAFTAAALVAIAPLFVHYGSEARGYAGMILMTFIAAETIEGFLDSFADSDSKGASQSTAQKCRLAFGVAIAIGALFHLTMLMAAATLFVAALLRLMLRGLPLSKVAHAGIDLAIPAALGTIPVAGFIIAGVVNTHKIELGAQTPFSLYHLGQGLSTLFEATLGLPYWLPIWAALAITAILVSWAAAVTPADRRILPLTALLLPPLLATLAFLPNVHIARFHLISALGLVLLMAELFAWLWRSHQSKWAVLLAAAICIGSASNLAPLLLRGRGDYQTLVRRMEAHGATTYGSNMEAELNRTLRFYDPRLGKLLVSAKSADWCKAPPDWYILSDDPSGEAPHRNFGPPECGTPYIRDIVISATPLSGLRLALYARQK